jgi:hypothetical protein
MTPDFRETDHRVGLGFSDRSSNGGTCAPQLFGADAYRRYGDAEDAYPLGSYATADAALNYFLGRKIGTNKPIHRLASDPL